MMILNDVFYSFILVAGQCFSTILSHGVGPSRLKLVFKLIIHVPTLLIFLPRGHHSSFLKMLTTPSSFSFLHILTANKVPRLELLLIEHLLPTIFIFFGLLLFDFLLPSFLVEMVLVLDNLIANSSYKE